MCFKLWFSIQEAGAGCRATCLIEVSSFSKLDCLEKWRHAPRCAWPNAGPDHQQGGEETAATASARWLFGLRNDFCASGDLTDRVLIDQIIIGTFLLSLEINSALTCGFFPKRRWSVWCVKTNRPCDWQSGWVVVWGFSLRLVASSWV